MTCDSVSSSLNFLLLLVLRPFSDWQVRRVRNHLVHGHGHRTGISDDGDDRPHSAHTHTHIQNERQLRIEIFFGWNAFDGGGAWRRPFVVHMHCAYIHFSYYYDAIE